MDKIEPDNWFWPPPTQTFKRCHSRDTWMRKKKLMWMFLPLYANQCLCCKTENKTILFYTQPVGIWAVLLGTVYSTIYKFSALKKKL